MIQKNLEIRKYKDLYREQILAVWEKSVLATHDFLGSSDFTEIRALVATINFNDFHVYCLMNDAFVMGFIGVLDKKIEMLFLHPQYFGQGFGKQLLDFAVTELAADKVDVNEQNGMAVGFYKKYGFETFERTEKDDQARDYPLLRMKLKR